MKYLEYSFYCMTPHAILWQLLLLYRRDFKVSLALSKRFKKPNRIISVGENGVTDVTDTSSEGKTLEDIWTVHDYKYAYGAAESSALEQQVLSRPCAYSPHSLPLPSFLPSSSTRSAIW